MKQLLLLILLLIGCTVQNEKLQSMKTKKQFPVYLILLMIVISFYACINKEPEGKKIIADNKAEFNYLKGLEGKWIVQGGDEGIFGWEFDLTSRDGVIIERLKTGTATEMLTIYNLDDGILRANHFCQLQNQPKLIAASSETEGDLHFLCTEEVGNTTSHDELHMHGVHFQKNDSSLTVWMDMYKNGGIFFETRYELFRVDSEQGQKLISLK